MEYDRQLLKGTVSIMVLKLLSENDMYGYQIIKELERRSERVFSLNEGALYPVLHKLECEGYVSAYWEEDVRRRKYYHLTQSGARQLESKVKQWRTFSGAMDTVLIGKVSICKNVFRIILTPCAPAYAAASCGRRRG